MFQLSNLTSDMTLPEKLANVGFPQTLISCLLKVMLPRFLVTLAAASRGKISMFTQPLLQHMEGYLNGIKIRRVRRQVDEPDPCLLTYVNYLIKKSALFDI